MIERSLKLDSLGNRAARGGKLCYTRYEPEGLPAVQRWIAETPAQWTSKTSVDGRASKDWDLNAGWEGACEMARDGWHDGAMRLSNNLAGVALPSNGTIGRVAHGVSGFRPNVARFCQGNPRNMVKRSLEDRQAPTLSLAIGSDASGACQGEHFANFGLAMAGLVQWIERTGTRVHLDIFCVGRNRGDGAGVAYGWNVKRAHEPLDESAMAFSLAHPAALRRIGFAIMERCPKAEEMTNYGAPKPLTKDIADAMGLAPDTVIIRGIEADFDQLATRRGAFRFIASRLASATGASIDIDVEAFVSAQMEGGA